MKSGTRIRHPQMNVVSIVLAGGVGRRLWPISTPTYPKHLSNIFSDKYIFEKTIKRNLRIFKRDNIVVTVGEKDSDHISKVIQEKKLRIPKESILLEPEIQNTSIAILYSLLTVKARYGEDCIVSIGPADLDIHREYAFRKAMHKAVKHVRDTSHIIVFGCIPKFVSPHMGYFKPESIKKYNVNKVVVFDEKPDFDRAQRYIDEGWLWNAGVFVCRIGALLNQYRIHARNLYDLFVKRIPQGADSPPDERRLTYSKTSEGDRKAFEYNVIQKINDGSLMFVPASYDYNNVGDWTSVYNLREVKKDKTNASLANFNDKTSKPFYKAHKALGEILGNFTYEGCKDCFFVMEHAIIYAFHLNHLLVVISKERKEIVISDRKFEDLICQAVEQPDTEERDYGQNLFQYLKDKEIKPCKQGNMVYGKSRSINANGNIAILSGGYTVNLIGVNDLFVAFDKERLLICPVNEFNNVIKKFTYSDLSKDQYSVLSGKRIFHDGKIWSSITFSMTIISIFLAFTSSDYWNQIYFLLRGFIYIFACIFLAMSIIIIRKHQYFEHMESRLLEVYEKEMGMMLLHSNAQELYKQFIRHGEFSTVLDSIQSRILKNRFIRRTRAVDMWVSIFMFICGALMCFAALTFFPEIIGSDYMTAGITASKIYLSCWFVLISILCIIYYKRDNVITGITKMLKKVVRYSQKFLGWIKSHEKHYENMRQRSSQDM